MQTEVETLTQVVVSGTAALDGAHPSPRATQQLRDCYLGQQRLDVGARRGLLNLRRSHGEHDVRPRFFNDSVDSESNFVGT